MRRRSTLRGVTAVVGAAALTVPLGYLATASATPTAGRHVLSDTHPTWAVAAHATGTPAASAHFTVDVALQLRDPAGAASLLQAVSSPGSAQHGQYLTTTQFNARFAPTSQSVASVESYLRGQGLTLGSVPSNNRYVEATGTTAQIQRTFDTTLRTYSVNGQTQVGPTRAMSVPADLAGTVLTVTGIGDAPMRTTHVRTVASTPAPNKKVPPPSVCSGYWNEHTQTVPHAYGQTNFPTYICGYQAGQFQSAYGIKHSLRTGHDGTGTKVAIIDAYASPTIESDANQLFTNEGEPTFTKGQFAQQSFRPFDRQKACQGAPDWWGEETLDVESVHAMAPGADELYVGAKDCFGGLNHAMNWIASNVDRPSSKAYGVSMISNSYGNAGEEIPANQITASEAIYMQAGLEGIGVYFSSGDSGDEVTLGHTTTAQPDFPASSPYVTGVGGTSLAIDSHDDYLWETGWGTDLDRVNTDGSGGESGYQEALPGDFYFGAGGGTSHVFRGPWYQRGIVPDALAESYNGKRDRVVPDVAMDGDPYTGTLEGITVDGTYTQYGIGGTSLATPLFVGLQATVQGRAGNIGFASPTLYSLPKAAFRDVQPPASPIGVTNPTGSYLVTLDHDSSLATAAGYDNVTGRGTPYGAAFIASEYAAIHQH
jgi:subtilase family serine protease